MRPTPPAILKRNLLVALLSAVMTLSLVPAPAFATEQGTSTSEGSTSSSSQETEEDTYLASIQSLPEDAYYPGEAMVIYHDAGLSVQDEDSSSASTLASSGYSVLGTWDVSDADELSIQSDESTSAASSSTDIPEGADLRVALVSKDGESTTELVSELMGLDSVEVAAPNYRYEAADTGTPDDTYYADVQRGLTDTTYGSDYASAYAADSTQATDNVVAVLDTGVDYTNPDLVGQMWTNPGNLGLGDAGTHGYDARDNDYDPMPGSSAAASHGTHCAGVIAAQTNNSEGIAGVAGADSHTKIMGLKATDASGGSFAAADIVSNYVYLIRAKEAGVNLVAVNNSWGVDGGCVGDDPVLDYLVNQAGKAGVLSVFAAGNDGTDASENYQTVMLESPYAIVVAASNEQNTVASFSNYDATGVDIAAPGSKIVSTVSTSCRDAFCPLLSKLAGKSLDYYTDVAENLGKPGWSVVLINAGGIELPEAAQAAVSVTPRTAAVYGQNSLRVTMDADALAALGLTASECRVRVSWACTNPFLGASVTPSDYEVGIMVSGSDLSASDNLTAKTFLIGSDGMDLVSKSAQVHATRDLFSVTARGTLDTVDTTSPSLMAGVSITYMSEDEEPTGTISFDLTGYGIGRNTDPTTDNASASVPYAFMNGTSMATPLITGSVAELASLESDKSPLELRGLICGSTEALVPSDDSEGNKKEVASGGRFTFADALSQDESKVNSNTWGITTEGTMVTLHGYALGDASLTADGAACTLTSQSDESISFVADSALLDGEYHAFVVTDASTGRTYKARYRVPKTDATTLEYVGSLPVDSVASTGVLVSATDRVFLADKNGAYLYSCADPSATGATWQSLAVPGSPLRNAKGAKGSWGYAYLDGSLYAVGYAFSAVISADKILCSCTYSYARYDIPSGTWSDVVELVDPVEDSTTIYGSILMASCGGKLYLVNTETADPSVESEHSVQLATSIIDGQTHERRSLKSFVSESSQAPTMVYASHGKLFGLSLTAGETTVPVLVSFDMSTMAMTELGAYADYPTIGAADKLSMSTDPTLKTGNGLVMAGRSFTGWGDMQLWDTSKVLSEVGNFGLASTHGLAVTSMATLDDTTYLTCSGEAVSEAGVSSPAGLYRLPTVAQKTLASIDSTLAADASEGGTATVSDWRGQPASSLRIRTEDTATWSASAEDGYTFAGWYDETGQLVSTDATYKAPVSDDATLTARFTKNSTPETPVSPETPQPAVDVTGDSSGTAQGQAIPKTGDASSLPLAAMAVLGLVLLVEGRRRRVR